MITEKVRLFQDRRAEELIMSSPGPRAHKRIDRGVRNFDYASWDRVREDAVLAGTFAEFTQKPAIKHHLYSALAPNLLLKPALLTPCGASVFWRTTPRTSIPLMARRKNCSVSSLCRPRRHSHKWGWVGTPRLLSSILHSDLVRQKSRDFPSAASPLGSGPRLPSFSFGISTCFSDSQADHSAKGLAVALDVDPSLALSEFGPSLLGVQLRSKMLLLSPKLVLTGHYLVDMLTQPDLLLVEQQFVASGWQVLPFVGVADLEPGDLLGVAHTPLIRVPLDALQHNSRLFPRPACGTPDLSRYRFTPRSCSQGLALACPARAFDSGPARFVSVRLGTPTVALLSVCGRLS